MEKYIIKHGSENWFLSTNKKVKWSSSLINAKEFKNADAALDVLNELNSQKNVVKPNQILALNPLSWGKLNYIKENYKFKSFNSNKD